MCDEEWGKQYKKHYNLDTYGLRYFNVYGRRQNPDGAYAAVIPKFLKQLLNGEAPTINGDGKQSRDFTYIDDIVHGVMCVMQKTPDLTEDGASYKVYNIGNNKPESLMYFVETLEEKLIEQGIIKEKGKRELLPMQMGDVYQTFADVTDLQKDFGFKPATPLAEGLEKFAKWYKGYYKK